MANRAVSAIAAAMAVSVLVGCSAAGDGSLTIEIEGPNVAESEIPAAQAFPPAVPVASVTGPVFPDVLYISPDESLMPFMQSVTDRYARIGLNVATSDDGIAMFLSSDLPEGSQARAYFKHWCFSDGCPQRART